MRQMPWQSKHILNAIHSPHIYYKHGRGKGKGREGEEAILMCSKKKGRKGESGK